MTERHLAIKETRAMLEALSAQDFRNFGLQQIAYIRMIEDDSGCILYSVHSADGGEMLVTDALDDAVFAVRQSNLEPVTVH